MILFQKARDFQLMHGNTDARVGWLPYYDKEKNKVLHIAANLRYGKPKDEKIALKSRPEANSAPQIINTGSFAADNSTHLGGEIYYSTGRLLVGFRSYGT